jgi:hypothetical protein
MFLSAKRSAESGPERPDVDMGGAGTARFIDRSATFPLLLSTDQSLIFDPL